MSLLEKPICENCKHRMVVKLAVTGQAQRGNGHQIEILGMVRQEVTQSVCKLSPLPITTNPCVLECSEFEFSEVQPHLRKPLAAEVGV